MICSNLLNCDYFLNDELGLDVDLIEKDTLKPRLKKQILEEAIKV